jgi:acyl-CoA hydrolase
MINNISFSRAETCLLMEPFHSNPYGNVHGGELMKIMDNVAGLAAAKHAKGIVVTARVDEIVFHRPIRIGDIITCVAQLAYVGTSSMQIMVNIFVHELENYSEPETALTAFFTMVHLVDNKPAKVQPLIVTTKEEEELYKLGEKKYKEIKSKYKI